ncbi:retrotransposon hot spot (RHS) protein, putative [Trypanosoma cruzi marinkellei]|uniref:Retrotransposon hot spot (RHS) protein, putative n=1 Tax=Trypanosoma cruzi marinkellei TaxID=85056 RepID=K2NX99_TRYCR|nr:retrotransposon hot spot (RHS) protein, putative [Trypanosoma cruzi marinkellei]
MKMNHFFTMELDGRGVMDTNRDVLLEAFFKHSEKYICGAGVLSEIEASNRYVRMERVLGDEMDMVEDVHKLYDNVVDNLLKLLAAAAEVKASVREVTKMFLDAAAEEARNPTKSSGPIYLEGLYESVYNAKWSHVVEVPGGEKTKTGTGMVVREGEPSQSWTHKAVGLTLERDDGAEQSGAARPRLMVLTSDKGWPYAWKEGEFISDCFVNCEVERVWQIVEHYLIEWFSSHRGTDLTPGRCLLVGTPGIGKSMNAGSYLLYQLLHCDIEKLPVVVYFIGNEAFLFENTTQTVEKYVDESSIDELLKALLLRGVSAYIIYDVAKNGRDPHNISSSPIWGMIVISLPNEDNFNTWAKEEFPKQIIISCLEKEDVKAMCIWIKQNHSLRDQAEYWKKVEDRMDKVGPLLRYIFEESKYNAWIDLCKSTVENMKRLEAEHYLILETNKMCDDNHVTHELVKVVRARGEHKSELPLNALVSSHLAEITLCKLAELMVPNNFSLLISRIKDDLISKALEVHSMFAFLSGAFVNAIIPELTELKITKNTATFLCAESVSTGAPFLSPVFYRA